MEEIRMDQMKDAAGGYVVADEKKNQYFIVRQDGTVVGPAPSKAAAQEFAKTFGESATVLTKEEYKRKFGKELVW